MFTTDFIQNLKQTNVSVDAEKTKERVKELWKSSTPDEKDTIEKLAGVARSTVARVYSTGSISAKIIVPMAQTLNVDPEYLTGAAESKGEVSDKSLRGFILKHGYEKHLADYDKSKKPNGRGNKGKGDPSPDVPNGNGEKDAPVETPPEANNCKDTIDNETQACIDSLTEDDMILLLRAAMLRAKSGGANKEKATKIKLLLLS